MIGSESGFTACLAAALATDFESLPAVEGDPSVFWRQWLARRNLGLVPVDDPASFAWPGSWIAVAETAGGARNAVLMFGAPSGMVLDPSGTAGTSHRIVGGVVVAPLDLQLDREQPYGVPGAAAGVVEAVLIAPDPASPLIRVSEVDAISGSGLVGDRYATGRGTFSGSGRGYELTLIEVEALEALAVEGLEVTWEEARRNIVTRGIDLNALVGVSFRVGEVECAGHRLAEPCAHLQRLAPEGILRGLVHRAGLRAGIVRSGTIRVGDAVTARD